MGVATVQGNKTSYTHTSSRKRPITPGQNTTYTVKAYNSKYKTYGRYNTKGLTTRTKPSAVRLKRAALSKDKKSISITWNRASGCNNYCIYRRTPSTKWKRIANVRVPRTSYVDRSPVKGQKNIYIYAATTAPPRIYGNYNTRGLTVSAPKNPAAPHPGRLLQAQFPCLKYLPRLTIRSISSGKRLPMPLTIRSTTKKREPANGQALQLSAEAQPPTPIFHPKPNRLQLGRGTAIQSKPTTANTKPTDAIAAKALLPTPSRPQ